MKTLIIAEAGVNHNGDLEIAKQLIDVAAEAGADFVKFQTFKTEKIISQKAKKAVYQIENTGKAQESQYDMVKKLELNEAAHHTLIEHCKLRNIGFLSTPFDLPSIALLKKIGISINKIPSGEITNIPYIKAVGKLGNPIIVSTGMCNLSEIEYALNTLYEVGVDKKQITVLHCNTEYPTPMEDVNLRAMNTIQQAFDVNVGYSDHTLGIEVPIAAVARGAVCIEKHFTLSREMEGPDHRASLEPEELKAMVSGIRNIEKALGSSIKSPSASERKNIAIARKSIHLNENLKAGHVISESDLIMKRPGDGISPIHLSLVIGRKLKADLPIEHKLSFNDFS